MGAFLHSNNVGRATTLFDEMIKEGVFLDSMAYFTLISGLTQVGKLDGAYSNVSSMKKNGFRVDIKSYNTLISGFCKNKRLDKAFEIHDEMCKVGLRPDIFTYNTLIDALCKVGDFSKADKFLSEMGDDGCKPNVVAYGTLINGFCKAGDLDRAMKFFRSMMYKIYCPTTYTSIFKGLEDHNIFEKAFKLMDKMSSWGCKPNYVTMDVLAERLTAISEIERLRLFVQRTSDIDSGNLDV
ncbi:pentatricopeptide repeat-containing protein At5g28460-like [Zingiber officinale]|uniref:pentatricopeptide repeat-containing protein At5g28460-like n=1 Tax=Zingiber officinale TaxID=94328 RepID=UPI001C4DB7D8|nr:pentatricopeptide repeat-containing protein At5g28460-like [Zingiber officinale]